LASSTFSAEALNAKPKAAAIPISKFRSNNRHNNIVSIVLNGYIVVN